MQKLFLFFAGVVLTVCCGAQDLINSRTTSPYTYFYYISDIQAVSIAGKGKLNPDNDLFYQKVDSFPTGSSYEGKLAPGNYLKAYVDRDRVDVEFLSIPNIFASVIDNQTDLLLQIRDSTGNIIRDATVSIGSLTIPYDEKSESYRLEKSNRHGIISVQHSGITSLIRLERALNNPGIKRGFRKTVYGTPVRYVWVPVKTVVILPFEVVISSFRGYGFYTAKRIWYSLKNTLTGEHPTGGYLVFNKPKYNPGDTVKLKTFILRGNRYRPYTGALDVKLVSYYPYRQTRLGTVRPYSPGGYTFSFVLEDSLNLQLDRDYEINMFPAGRDKVLSSGNFRYEYYDLKGLKLNMRLPEEAHYCGKPFFAALKAVNENDMVLPDVRVSLFIMAGDVDEIFTGRVTLRDTLAVIREDLQASGETMIEIPDSIFPAANLKYRIVAQANTSDNETASEEAEVIFIRKKEEIEVRQAGDSIEFILKVDGEETVREASVESEDAFGNRTAPVMKTFPFALRIDPFVASYTVKSGSAGRKTTAADLSPGVRCNMFIRNDSVIIDAGSSAGITFNYFIYEFNREISRGVTENLQFSRVTSGNREWYLSMNYLWCGVMNNVMYRAGLQKDKLNITVDQPGMIVPGSAATITLMVTGYNGKPVKNTDLTAFSLTGKFGYTLPTLPSLARPAKQKEQINRFTAETPDNPNLWYPFHYEKWKQPAGLDTIEYFNFRFHPDEVRVFLSDMGDSITQFAPFIFNHGNPVKINNIYIDHRPLYIDFAAANQPYSFRVDTGYHYISIRTPECAYEIDSLRFVKGRKLILSISDRDDPVQYTKKSAAPRLSKAESERLRNYILPFRSTFNNNIAWLHQSDRIFLMSNVRGQLDNPYRTNRGNNFEVVGPVMPRRATFVAPGLFRTEFEFEPGYEYEFRKELLKMKSFEAGKWVPRSLGGFSPAKDFRESVYTPVYLDSLRREILKARTKVPFNYMSNRPSKPGNGSVGLLGMNDRNGSAVALILFNENLRRVHTRRGSDRSFTNIAPGSYTFVALYDRGEYFRIDSVIVSANSRTYIDMNNASVENDSELFNRVLELISLPVEYGREKTTYEKQLLQEFTRQDFSSYDGPGFTITGRVTSADDDEAIPGVSVYCGDLKVGTITDFNGLYSLKLPSGTHKLTFAFIGMQQYETEVSYEQTLDVTLESDMLALDEVVVVGYGLSARKSVTASAVTVTESLSGSVAGLAIESNPQIMIRGATVMMNEMPPLVIIDGRPYTGDLSDLDPGIIREADIIRDPAMVALYGSRAAGGIIMLKTGAGGVLTTAPDKGVNIDDAFMEQAMAGGTLRRNFRDYAYWMPQLRTDDSGRVRFDVTFPDDITSWDTYVLGMTAKRQSGTATGRIRAFMPVVAQLAAPRYLIEDDTVNMIGKIVNYTPAPVNLTERFICNADTLFSRPQHITDAVIDTITVTAGSADSLRMEFSFTTEAGLKDGEYRPVPVYRVGLETDTGTFVIMDHDTSFTADLGAFTGEVTLTAMAGAPDLLRDNSYRLIRYQYRCNEQMASKLIGMLSAEIINKFLGAEKHDDRREILKLIKQLKENRNDEGLWGWWGKSGTEVWITQHVIRALEMAGENGYTVESKPAGFVDRAVAELESEAPFAVRLPLLELLSMTGARVDYIRYLTDIRPADTLSFTDSLRITALRQNHGLPVDLGFMKKAMRTTVYGGVWFSSGDRPSTVTCNDISTTLLAYSVLKADTAGTVTDLLDVRRYFLETLTFGNRLNTWQTAMILRTILPDVIKDGGDGKETKLSLAGTITKEIDTFPFSVDLRPEGAVSISKKGVMPVFLSLTEKLFITDPSADTTDFKIETCWSSPGDTVRSGEPVTLTAEVEFFKSADYLLIEIPVPAGFSYNSKTGRYAGEVHREFYRDHVAVFIRHADPGKKQFLIDLMPRFTGKYTANPARVSLMYFPSIYSNNEIKKIEIH
jgi:hypothetical protein